MIALFTLIGLGLIVFILVSLFSPVAYGISFTQPVNCRIGETCFIQNYVDLDPGDGWADYTCGPLSYDGHKGVDFRTANLVQMRKGVQVIAPADGTVLRLRDNMPDVSIREEKAPDVEGVECGNGLVMEHAGGWQTQYCHMKRGSVAVREGQRVARGDVLGEIGMSGSTEFPHLHFQVTDPQGAIVDPFAGAMATTACGAVAAQESLWTPETRQALAYLPTAILSHGFSDARPNETGARAGEFSNNVMSPDADPFVFWVDAYGLRDGDRLVMQLMGPDRVALVNHATTIEGDKAQWFQFIGKRLTARAWPEGSYHGTYRLFRADEDKPVIEESFRIDVIEQP